MGRITVFTGDDIHSERVLAQLEARCLPYTAISLAAHPNKLGGVLAKSAQVSVPQVFFNNRFVGGVEATIEELRKWDAAVKYPTPLDKYRAEIQSHDDPTSKAFQVPVERKATSRSNTLKAWSQPIPITLPDRTRTTVADITEKLKNSLPLSDNKHKGVLYKNSFTGSAAVKTIKVALGIAEEEAIAFAHQLLVENVIRPISFDAFVNCDKNIYRLQCHSTPEVLNSYQEWKKRSTRSCVDVFDSLDTIMAEIERDCVDDNCTMDLSVARSHRLFCVFEAAVCELQVVNMIHLMRKERLAFGLNVYNMMIKYGFIKIGIPTSETSQKSFLSTVKFNVGNKTYTFDSWFSRVIKQNSTEQSRRQVSWMAPAGRQGASSIDNRIHFGVSVGAFLGSTVSLPFRKYSASEVDIELEVGSCVFFEDEFNISTDIHSDQHVCLSSVLRRHRSDFAKKDRHLVEMLSKFILGRKKCVIEKLLDLHSDDLKVSFVELDYTRNVSNFEIYEEKKIKGEVKGLRALLRRFIAPLKPKNEGVRLQALRSLSILDTLPEERFDRITRMVQQVLHVPIVLISLVDEDRQWFKSSQWIHDSVPQPNETGRDVSFCGHTILKDPNDVMWVEDARMDDRFADNPFVTGDLGLRFYAGANLSVAGSDGKMLNIGTLCIIDQKPRSIDKKDVSVLQAYARQVRDEMLGVFARHPTSCSAATRSIEPEAFVRS